MYGTNYPFSRHEAHSPSAMAGNYKRTGILIGNFAEDVLAYDLVTQGHKELAKFTADSEAHARFPDPKRAVEGGSAKLQHDL